jgi:type VI secretion system protein ImpG
MDHDDPILRYYEAEMRYLREAGKEFAKAHPDRARMLNLDRVGDRDPYVERLYEGFAFLTGRLQQKLDDELPELTEGLVQHPVNMFNDKSKSTPYGRGHRLTGYAC